MNPDQLRETAMARPPAACCRSSCCRRRATNTLKLFNLLMGKGEASSRRAWMEENGHLVEADL
jgi:topoisomerase-4 subunit B